MPAKSESANPRPWWRIPRWILEVWLWAAVAYLVFEEFGCRHSSYDSLCEGVRNGSSYLFSLFPTGVFLFFPPEAPAWVPWAGVVICVLACHGLMRRLLPDRVLLVQALGLVLAAWLLNYASFLLFLEATAYRTTGHVYL